MNEIKNKSKVSEFVSYVVDTLNNKDDSVIGIISTNEHAYMIIAELMENYECSSDLIQWERLENCDDVIICIFNNGDTGILAAQPLRDEYSGRVFTVGADYTFMDMDLQDFSFIDEQNDVFEYRTFRLEHEEFECDGDCCNCEHSEEPEDTFVKKFMNLFSAVMDMACYFITEE